MSWIFEATILEMVQSPKSYKTHLKQVRMLNEILQIPVKGLHFMIVTDSLFDIVTGCLFRIVIRHP